MHFFLLLFFNIIRHSRLLLKLAVSYVHYEVLISVEWPAYMCVKSNVDRNKLLSSRNVWRAHIYIWIRVNKFYASPKKMSLYGVEKPFYLNILIPFILQKISMLWVVWDKYLVFVSLIVFNNKLKICLKTYMFSNWKWLQLSLFVQEVDLYLTKYLLFYSFDRKRSVLWFNLRNQVDAVEKSILKMNIFSIDFVNEETA
jgi:hypothetical protein